MRPQRWRGAVLLAAILALNACAASSSANKEKSLFRIENGQSVRDIAGALQRAGYLSRPKLFLAWAKLLSNKKRVIRPGVYPLPRGASAYRILQTLYKGPASARVAFPEGWTARQMSVLLESHNVVASEAFLERVAKDGLEGYLFPDTYVFEQNSEVETVIQTMRRRFSQMIPADWTARAKALRLTEKQLVTLASIVEREAVVAEERPLIAGVYYNRLRKRMRLEADPTVQYALGAWKPRLTYKDLDVQSPYNTYRHVGLPPGPIGNPGAAALDAAAHPAQTDMLFFVAAGDGAHRFSRTYAEHLNAQKRRKP